MTVFPGSNGFAPRWFNPYKIENGFTVSGLSKAVAAVSMYTIRMDIRCGWQVA